MKKYFLSTLFLTVLFYGFSFSQPNSPVRHISGKTPVGFETEINAFLKQDSISFPPSGAWLFTGSSTIRKWDNLAADFNEITLIQRGFGGSTMEALNYYCNVIVLPYKPATIVVYEGDNDLANGTTPANFIARCDTFIRNVHQVLPGTIIYFMSIKPSPSRLSLVPAQLETNRLLKKLTRKYLCTGYIDITKLMYTGKGKLRNDLFEADALHITPECYRLWAVQMKKKMHIRR